MVGIKVEKKIRVYDLIELDLSLFENTDVTNTLTDEIHAEFACIRASFPVGLEILGVFITQPEQENIEVSHFTALIFLKGKYNKVTAVFTYSVEETGAQ